MKERIETNDKYIKLSDGRLIPLNTPEEDAAITKAAMEDPDAIPFTEEEWEAGRHMLRIGSGAKVVLHPSKKKTSIPVRLSSEVISGFKAMGSRWQSKMDKVLKEWLRAHPAR